MANVNKIACVLVLDASGSMQQTIGNGWSRIDSLNAAIEQGFSHELKNDLSTRKAVEVAIVSVSGSEATIVQDWVVAQDFEYQPLSAYGMTPLAGGFKLAVSLCEERKKHYLSEGIDYYRPWIIIITDGVPTDGSEKWAEAVNLAQEVKEKKKAYISCAAVDDTKNEQKDNLKQLTTENWVADLSSHSFAEYFLFLSNSLSATSKSSDGKAVMDFDELEQIGIQKII